MVAAVWVALLVGIVRQPVFLTTDMVSNHVHIWYVAEQLWHEQRLPMRMPVLASGDAYAFPYAMLPWIVGALLWPLGGDRVVTAMLVAGALATVAATFWALPRLRRGWWAVAVLVNPSLVVSVMLGQLPFLWAAAAFMVAIGMWRRGGWVAATVLAARGADHPPGRDAAGVDHRHPVRAAVRAASRPAAAVLAGGGGRRRAGDVDDGHLAGGRPDVTLDAALQPRDDGAHPGARARHPGVPRRARLAVGEGDAPCRCRSSACRSCSLGLAWLPFQLDVGWSGVVRTRPPDELKTFLEAQALEPGRIYRVLPGADQKYGLYQVVRHGAVLDSEFFPESLRRKGFQTDEEYAASWPSATSRPSS